MIELELLGGARTVTGSKHLLRTSRAAILLDCGLFQGLRHEASERNRHLGIDVRELDAVVLSHAHLDHSGGLPALVKEGFRKTIYASPATRDLCAPTLADAAAIQEADAHRDARQDDTPSGRSIDLEPVAPLYTRDDVVATLALIVGLPFHRRELIAPGIELTLFDAGQVLGSAIVVLDVTDGGERVRLAFTGDLGRPHLPIFRDPEVPSGIDVLITESNYGDRLHEPLAFAEALRRNGTVRQVILVHGEPRAQDALASQLSSRRFPSVIVPAHGQRLQIA